MKSIIETLREWVANRITYTPEPREKSIAELLAEERASNPYKYFIYYDSDYDDEKLRSFLILTKLPLFLP